MPSAQWVFWGESLCISSAWGAVQALGVPLSPPFRAGGLAALVLPLLGAAFRRTVLPTRRSSSLKPPGGRSPVQPDSWPPTRAFCARLALLASVAVRRGRCSLLQSGPPAGLHVTSRPGLRGAVRSSWTSLCPPFYRAGPVLVSHRVALQWGCGAGRAASHSPPAQAGVCSRPSAPRGAAS